MDTSCKLCVLAEYEGNVQVGCQIGRLDKFKDGGAVLDIQSDEDKDYFMIRNRVCNACTQESVVEGIPSRKWEETIMKRIGVRCNMAVYVGPNHTFYDALQTLDSIVNQEHPAYEIKVLLQGKHDVGEYMALMNNYKLSIPWIVQEIVYEIEDLDKQKWTSNYLMALDLTMENIKSTYYSVSNAGYEYSSAFLSTINRALNIDLNRFVALLPDADGNGSLLQRGFHKLVGGNRSMPVFDKLAEIAEIEDTAFLIKRFEDL